MAISLQQNIPLAPLTTIQLGGVAKGFVQCTTDADIIEALSYANEHNLRVHVLGGGSNSIFADEGFDGLVIHIATKGITMEKRGEIATVTVQAGEDWDSFVQYAIAHGLTGIECLSGIPGSCGGTPLQNVGAYGQEVGQTISTVDAIDRASLQKVRFTNAECRFGNRTSRFKEEDYGKYIITAISFQLTENGMPAIRYGELTDALGDTINPGVDGLTHIRNAVLALRKKKSMLIDNADPNSISCGSFFTNPIISSSTFAGIQKKTQEQIPFYTLDEGLVKVPAAWLVEHAGFSKGTVRGNIGISKNHSLAIINVGGTTRDLLLFAKEIQSAVQQQFGVSLVFEPVVIPP